MTCRYAARRPPAQEGVAGTSVRPPLPGLSTRSLRSGSAAGLDSPRSAVAPAALVDAVLAALGV